MNRSTMLWLVRSRRGIMGLNDHYDATATTAIALLGRYYRPHPRMMDRRLGSSSLWAPFTNFPTMTAHTTNLDGSYKGHEKQRCGWWWWLSSSSRLRHDGANLHWYRGDWFNQGTATNGWKVVGKRAFSTATTTTTTTSTNQEPTEKQLPNDDDDDATARWTTAVADAGRLLALGGNPWMRLQVSARSAARDVKSESQHYHTGYYQSIVREAIERGIRTLEVPDDRDGQTALVQVVREYLLQQQQQQQQSTRPPIQLLWRMGYRTIPPASTVDVKPTSTTDEMTATSTAELPSAAVVAEIQSPVVLFPYDFVVETYEAQVTDRVLQQQQQQRDRDDESDLAALSSLRMGQRQHVRIVHNLEPAYLHTLLHQDNCDPWPLIQLQQEFPNKNQLAIIPVLHNPEVQAQNPVTGKEGGRANEKYADLSPHEQRQWRIRKCLVEAMIYLEEQVQHGSIAGYGVVSNGLGLPSDHPLHCSWNQAIFPAAQAVHQQLQQRTNDSSSKKTGSKISSSSSYLHLIVVQLPANVLETTGLTVAREIRHSVLAKTGTLFSPQQLLQIHAMRPLTCYPDGGTGRGYPLILADYPIIMTENKNESDKSDQSSSDLDVSQENAAFVATESPDPSNRDNQLIRRWTHEMTGPPAAYYAALQHAMAHFDAEELVQAKVSGRPLTCQERETLDGCKLLQSVLHDVDVGLEQISSFQAHEEMLYHTIIPMIHDTFEGYDEETATVLQTFFAAYSMAVRYAIARNTRRMLLSATNSSSSNQKKENATIATTPNDEQPNAKLLYPHQRLQDYALQYLLQCQDPIQTWDKIVIGCSQPDHVLDMVETMARILVVSQQQKQKQQDDEQDEEQKQQGEEQKQQEKTTPSKDVEDIVDAPSPPKAEQPLELNPSKGDDNKEK